MINVILSSVFEGKLIEVLLTAILTFNVGAYSFVWYKLRSVEEKSEDNEQMIMKIFKRIFGMEEDQTDEGYLVETNKEFARIDERLDGIEDKIDIIGSSNEEAHEGLQEMFEELAYILVEDEDTNVTHSDIEEIKR